MKIPIPTEKGVLSAHFGHCEQFTLLDVNGETGEITASEEVDAPQHQPGLFPRWLANLGADMIIAGGMGQKAQTLFAQNNIQVVTGAASQAPKKVVEEYFTGKLTTAPDPCSGGHGDCGKH